MAAQRAGLAIVPLSAELLDACAGFAAHAPDPWARHDLQAALENLNRWTFVAVLGKTPVAFACFFALAESADLEMLVVHPEHRGRGIGAHLLRQALAELARQGVQRCLLEVRASNTAAQALYAGLGFRVLATRSGMYSSPAEDGLLMARALRAQHTGKKEASAP